MKRLLVLAAVLFFWFRAEFVATPLPPSPPLWLTPPTMIGPLGRVTFYPFFTDFAIDCDETTLDSTADMVSTSGGDTITCNDSTETWSAQKTWDRPFTLQANDACNLDGDGRATSTGCGTIIQISVDYPVSWNCTAGEAHRITGLHFTGDGAAVGGSGPVLYMNCSNEPVAGETATFRFDHNYVEFDATENPSRVLWCNSCVGVIDHNHIQNDGNQLFYIENKNWWGNGEEAPPNVLGRYGDESRYYPLVYGSATYYQSLFIEDNTMIGADKGCTDGNAGARFVVRRNDIDSCSIKVHGFDSTGRSRAVRQFEVYQNTFDKTGDNERFLVEMRDGNAVVWDNDATNIGAGYNAGILSSYRVLEPTIWPGPSDGYSLWDVNDAGNPQDPMADTGCDMSNVCTASGGGTLTVDVTGANWTADELVGYIIRKEGCTEIYDNVLACHSLVTDNDTDTITFAAAPAGSTSVSFSASDTFTLNKVTRMMDQPGTSDAELLKPHYAQGFGITGFGFEPVDSDTAKFTTDTGEDELTDIEVNDYIMVSAGGTGHYSGTYQVATKPSQHIITFDYPGSGATGVSGTVTKKPDTIANYQTVTPVFQFLNTNTDGGSCSGGCNLEFSLANASPFTLVDNVNFVDYDTSLAAFNGTLGGGENPIYVGNKAGLNSATSNMTTCDLGAIAWVTDEGEWDSSNGATADGKMYRCAAANTWTAMYLEAADGGLPYDYPHPLVSGDEPEPPSPVTGRFLLRP